GRRSNQSGCPLLPAYLRSGSGIREEGSRGNGLRRKKSDPTRHQPLAQEPWPPGRARRSRDTCSRVVYAGRVGSTVSATLPAMPSDADCLLRRMPFRGDTMRATWLPLIALTLSLPACLPAPEASGPTQHETKDIELDQAQMVRVNLAMGAGELRVGSGASK